jgi:RNA polymerase sigma factor (sigma-70 family)
VINSSDRFEKRAQVSTWILQIARNLCLNHVRDSKWETDLSDGQWRNLEDPNENIESLLMEAQKKRIFQDLLAELPAPQKTLLMLWISGDQNQSKIAQELQISVGSVKVQLHRIKESLIQGMRKRS